MCKDRNGNYINCNGGQPSLPRKKPLITVIKDGVQAQSKILSGVATLAETETIEKRRAICFNCEYISNILNTQICGYCKCPILEKTKYKDFSCDLGRWG